MHPQHFLRNAKNYVKWTFLHLPVDFAKNFRIILDES